LEEVTLSPLEQKWQQEKDERGPSLDDAYDENGRFEPAELEDVVKSRIPTPTGWRIAILPYRGAEKTKGGIVLVGRNAKAYAVGDGLRVCLESGDFGLHG
jgi:hypothetical protein